MLKDDIDSFSMEQHIQLDESDLDETIEILDNAQQQSNQNFDQAQIDQNHDEYDSDSSLEDLEGDFLARSWVISCSERSTTNNSKTRDDAHDN